MKGRGDGVSGGVEDEESGSVEDEDIGVYNPDDVEGGKQKYNYNFDDWE